MRHGPSARATRKASELGRVLHGEDYIAQNDAVETLRSTNGSARNFGARTARPGARQKIVTAESDTRYVAAELVDDVEAQDRTLELSKTTLRRAVWFFLATTTPGLAACAKKLRADNEDINHHAPPPAPIAPGLATYAWKADGLATFQLKTKGMLLRGNVGGVRGQLTLDAADLSRCKATLSLDLSTLHVGASGEEGSADQYSKEARAWFGLGDATPAASGDGPRTASFRLTALTQLNATTPLDGARFGHAETGTAHEQHRVRAVAEGELLLHGFRVHQAVPITLDFTYASPSAQDPIPESVQVTSRSPFPLSLLAHDILPRTESGVVVSEKARELGKTMGSEALVEFDFQATRISR